MWNDFKRESIESTPARDVKTLVDSGAWVLVDVRLPSNYEEAHAADAVSIPAFVEMKMGQNMSGVGDFLKAAALLSNGVTPVKKNDDFMVDAKKASENGKKGLIFYCEAGGTLKPSMNFMYGKQSRSLQAMHEAMKAGLKVGHLDGGIYSWYQEGLPMVGEYDEKNVGRTPNAALAATYHTEDKEF